MFKLEDIVRIKPRNKDADRLKKALEDTMALSNKQRGEVVDLIEDEAGRSVDELTAYIFMELIDAIDEMAGGGGVRRGRKVKRPKSL